MLDLTSSKPDRTPEAEQKYKEAVERREVKLGMTKSEVKAAIGSPRRSGKTSYRGERVLGRVVEVCRGFARAEPQQLIEASPARRAPPCPHAERCGGCAYQPLAYAEQLRVKEAILRESLARARVSFAGELPVRASPESGSPSRHNRAP